jgi:hypothetical protein
VNDLTPDAAVDEDVVDTAAERRRSRRSVSFILAVVGAAVVVIGALALWVLVVPYHEAVPLDGGPVVDCSIDPAPPETVEAMREWERACDEAEADTRDGRRRTAFVVGVGAFVVATAVSTWPSRRLTGDRLGPLR